MIQMIVVFILFCVFEYALKRLIEKKGGRRRK